MELFTPAVDGAFRQGRARQFTRFRFIKTDLHTIRDTLDFFNNGIGQGISVLPKGIKLFFHPCDTFRGCVLPEDFVVLGKRAFGLVDGA